jgi:hypothetical protein
MEDRTRVLVIGGWGRCGSTLLDMMLGQIEGFVSAGEVRELWLRGCVENRPCGCGEPFLECAFWSKVGVEAFGGWNRLDLDTVMRVRYRLDRAWGLPRLALPPHRGGEGTSELDRYVVALERLFAAIAAVSGAKVVVDSSKLPTHTLVLARAERLELRMVHLVRDSRGVAFSNRKHVLKSVTSGEPTALPRYGSLASATRYDLYNGANSLVVGRRVATMRLRYEDLVEDPQRRLLEVVSHATDGGEADVSFVSGGQAVLASNHLVDGNPVRFAQGPLRLTVDDAWRRQLAAKERRAMTALTYPLLKRYGYAVR